jgi:SAM-dependent methyltransferase
MASNSARNCEKRATLSDRVRWLRDGFHWRLVQGYYDARRMIWKAFGGTSAQWLRVVMDRETDAYARSLAVASMDALEISGDKWKSFGFRSYRSVDFPQYDICEGPLAHERFDFIVAEQVLEHVLWPYRAVRHLYQMLRPGGVLIVTTPFLVRVHDYPIDCSRWTELGLKYLLAEAGFELDKCRTGSWGNRACVKANFDRWRHWLPWWHSLKNDQSLPLSVWAFVTK